jgi:putative tricarboxylic transport membrane protein
MLIILNLPLVPLFAQILRLPVHMLFPLIFGVSMVGVYAATGNVFNLGLLSLFGLLGFVMRKLKFPATPLLLGFVLGDSMEQALRQSLMMSQGDPLTFVERPMSAIMLALAVIILISPLLGRLNRARLRAITENG